MTSIYQTKRQRRKHVGVRWPSNKKLHSIHAGYLFEESQLGITIMSLHPVDLIQQQVFKQKVLVLLSLMILV